MPRGVIAVDPAIDGNTGQQTIASKALDSRLLQRAADKFAQFDVAPVSSNILGKAQFVLAATLTPIDASKGSRRNIPDQPFADRYQDGIRGRAVRNEGAQRGGRHDADRLSIETVHP